jgi:integrase/recombinase XerC
VNDLPATITTGIDTGLAISGRDAGAEFIRFLDVSPRTFDTYRKALSRWTGYLEEQGIRGQQATREDIVAYRDGLKASKKPATVNLYLGVVRLFYQFCESRGLCPNIARHVKGVKISEGFKKDYLTSGQVRNVIGNIERNGAKGLRDYAVFALCVTAGLRTVEVARANIEDMRTLGGDRVLYIQGKGHGDKDALVKLVPEVEAAIMAYLKAAGTPEEGQPLFRSDAQRNRGGRLTTRSISRMIKNRLKGAGYNDSRLTAHSLRHTCATLNLLGGGSLEETQQLLRHKDISTTQIYSHALTRAGNNSEARVASAIFGGTQTA